MKALSVIRDGGFMFGSQLLVNIFSIAISIYIVRTVGKAELALIPLSSLFGGMLTAVGTLGLTSTCVRRTFGLISRGKEKRAASILKTTLLCSNVMFFLILGLMFLFSSEVAKVFLKDETQGSTVRLLVPVVFFSANFIMLHLLMQSVNMFGKLSIVQLVSRIIQQALIIPLYFFWGKSGLVAAILSGEMGGVLFFLYYLRGLLLKPSRMYPLKTLLSFSGSFYLYGIVRFITVRSDQLLIGILMTPEDLSVYFVATKVTTYLQMLIDSLFRPVYPKLSELKSRGKQKMETAFAQISKYISVSLIPVCVGISVCSYPLLHIYAGSEYLDAAPSLSILAMAMLAFCYFSSFNTHVFIYSPPSDTLKLELVTSSAGLISGFILIQHMGVFGAAASRFITFLTGLFISYRLLGKIMNVKIDLASLLKASAASIIAGSAVGLCLFLKYNLFYFPLYLLLGVLILFFLYLKMFSIKEALVLNEYIPKKIKNILLFNKLDKIKTDFIDHKSIPENEDTIEKSASHMNV